VIKAQRIGAGKCGSDAIVDQDDTRRLMPGSQSVLPEFEFAEIRFQHMFVAGEGEPLSGEE